MYIIENGTLRYGPFKTASAAVEWALKNFSNSGAWRVARLEKP